jgi:hypothetical protein
MNKPLELSPAEWQEIVQIQEIRDLQGLSDESPEEFASHVYGVKFDFVSGGPGYFGDLYILQGDALTEASPTVLVWESADDSPGRVFESNQPWLGH